MDNFLKDLGMNMECYNCKTTCIKTRYPIANGNWQCKLQCPKCGWKASNAVKMPDNFNTLPLWDENAWNRYKKREAWENQIKNAGHTVPGYENYLASPEWKQKRDKIIQKNPFCQECKINFAEDVHHLTYKNLYNEKDYELIALCRSCHKKIHGIE